LLASPMLPLVHALGVSPTHLPPAASHVWLATTGAGAGAGELVGAAAAGLLLLPHAASATIATVIAAKKTLRFAMVMTSAGARTVPRSSQRACWFASPLTRL